ncbi:type II and III secretion system protein family protein [Bradyrhizobium liaoningense]|uniref:type II and III secretion system protein family protein n=1 Tax=Bradyrhizobium liaoningense TaxID=43992 RepID=UPI001BACD1AD|nr:type II and III secretion system protein family protein [Bradyrhizobium liaoningense]MBR0707006.1 type II and III secretion system protein family protein [Bradyrhizobium liaoningense]
MRQGHHRSRIERRSSWIWHCWLSIILVFAALLGERPFGAIAADGRNLQSADATSQLHFQFLSLGVGKSVVVDLPRDAKDILVADPKIANAVVRSAQRAYIIGGAIGQTSVVFFDSAGQQIMAYDIAVTRDLNGARATLQQIFPRSKIQIEGLGDGVILTGTAASPVEAQQANDIAARLVGSADKVVNSIVVQARDQVMLKVTVAEVSRSIVKQLGIDLSTSVSSGSTAVSLTNSNPFTAYGQNLVSGNNATLSAGGTTATLRAMETAGIMRTLAEPTLTAISGESATFVSGGEFPVPAGYSCDPSTHVCNTQISFKKFGLSLNFSPVVLSEGRISLHLMTEVSELSNEHSITLSQAVSDTTTNSLTVPSIKTRRAESTLEIPSGGSMAIAGLIQDQTKRAVNGLPGLMQLPVLGALFRSQDFVNNQTELMVLVTPYIVRATSPKNLSRPDDGFVSVSDPQASLLGSINRLYGTNANQRKLRRRSDDIGFIND